MGQEEHPDRERLERFLGDELPADERRAVVRHLLTGCPQCTAVTRRLWSLTDGPEGAHDSLGSAGSAADGRAASVLHPASYSGLFERVAARGRKRERALAAERAEAPRLTEHLLRAPAARRLGMAQADPRLASAALVDLLLERSEAGSRAAAPQQEAETGRAPEPIEPVELAELALAVAERLDPERCGAAVARDLLLRAWAGLGEARRRVGDLAGGEEALAGGERLLREEEERAGAAYGAGAAGERPDLLLLAGGLAADRGRHHAAGALLERAVGAARAADEPRLLARALLEHGLALAASGRLEAAIAALEEGAAEPLAEAAEPSLLGAGLERLTDVATTLGRSAEAARVLARLRPLAARLGSPSGPRLRWLEGRIAEVDERAGEAEAAFLQARAGLLALARGRDAALVSLDLALLYLRDRRWSELRRLAGELYPIFAARDMRREALMALLVFRRAVESETVSVELLMEIARYLSGFRARA
jgi:hypothetical protein